MPRVGFSEGKKRNYPIRPVLGAWAACGRNDNQRPSNVGRFPPYRKESRIKAGRHRAARPVTNAGSAGVGVRGQDPSHGAVTSVKTRKTAAVSGPRTGATGSTRERNRDYLSQKQKFALYLPSDLRSQIDRWYAADDCTSVNEFILKATRFYISHLAAHEDNPHLPAAISSAIEGRLGVFEDRMARLMFKQAVEQATTGLILAQLQDFDKAAVEQMRGWSVNAVKRTNGKLSLKDVLGSV